MSEWKEVKLSETCDLIAGYAFKSKDFGDYPAKVLKIADINPPFVSSKNSSGVDLSKYDVSKLKKFVVTKGDYILAMTGATIGKLGRFISEENAYLNQRVLKFKPHDSIDSNFLYYVLSGRIFAKYVINHIDSESAQPNISAGTIGKYSFILPDLDTQCKISSVLTSLDDKIAVNRRICENLEAQAQALFKHWFIDFAPFKNGKFVESELGMIPEGWRVGSPYEYVDFIYGAPYKSNLFNDKKEGLPLIRIRDLKDCSPQFYTPEILPKTEYVEAGDVLAGMDAEFAPYIWKGQKGLLNQRVCKIKPKNTSIGRLFCMLLVKPQLLFVQAIKTGTTVSHIGKSDIDRFKVVLPPFEDVERFSIIGEEILEAIVTLSAENLRLSTLRDTLLPKLMSGQIKV